MSVCAPMCALCDCVCLGCRPACTPVSPVPCPPPWASPSCRGQSVPRAPQCCCQGRRGRTGRVLRHPNIPSCCSSCSGLQISWENGSQRPQGAPTGAGGVPVENGLSVPQLPSQPLGCAWPSSPFPQSHPAASPTGPGSHPGSHSVFPGRAKLGWAGRAAGPGPRICCAHGWVTPGASEMLAWELPCPWNVHVPPLSHTPPQSPCPWHQRLSSLAAGDQDAVAWEALEVHVQGAGPGDPPDQLHVAALLLRRPPAASQRH